MKKNIFAIAIVIAGIAIAGAIIYIGPGQISEKGKTEGELSIEEASKQAIEFVNKILLDGQANVSLLESSEEYGLYKMKISLFEDEINIYVTRNGKLLFPEAINVEEMTKAHETMIKNDFQVDETDESENEKNGKNGNEEDADNNTQTQDQSGGINQFITCLRDKGFMIYGAEWCPYCADLVSLFGGEETAEPIYVECTEEPVVCQEKQIPGYPTILINNEPYTGTRSLEAFAQKTGCNL